MAKKGAALEQLVALIQDTLKDRQDVTIETNVQVVDITNIKREIDVLVTTNVQELPYVIAFECKDYSKKAVNIQVIDAFIGKCKYLTTLHRKVVVSTSGFTENARKRAEEEDIVLCSLEGLPLDTIEQDIKAYNPMIRIISYETYFTISSNDKSDLNSVGDCFDCYSTEGDLSYDFGAEVKQRLGEYSNRIALIEHFMKNGQKPFFIDNVFPFAPGVLYLKDNEGKRIGVDQMILRTEIDVVLEEGEIVKQQKYVQGKEVFITENLFDNLGCPFSVAVTNCGDKWSAAFRKEEQYVKPSFHKKL